MYAAAAAQRSKGSAPPVNKSSAPPPELFGDGSAGSARNGEGSSSALNRRKRRHTQEDTNVADSADLDNAMRLASALLLDFRAQAAKPEGLLSDDATGLWSQIESCANQIAELFRPGRESDERHDALDEIASGLWNMAVNVKVADGEPEKNPSRTIVAECALFDVT